MKKISWKNFGAIKAMSAGPISGGGILVLVGGQGTGKSTALAGVTQLLCGQSKGIDLQPRDGHTRGELRIGAAKLTVTRGQKRSKGELEVQHIEGRFDISKLVEPGIKDPVAADQARIKALIALSGATAKPSDFYAACGGQEAFDSLGVDYDTTDPIVLAGRTSRALHATARNLEKQSKADFSAAKAKQSEADKTDLSKESDSDVLRARYDGALNLATELVAKRTQYTEQQAAVADAYKAIEDLEAPSVSIADAIKSVSDSGHSLNVTLKEIDVARADLARAESALESRQTALQQSQQVLELAQSHVSTVTKLKDVIATAQLEPVADEKIAAADTAWAAAGEAVEIGATIRQAMAMAKESDVFEASAIEAESQAEKLREQSKDVDEILSGLIPKGNLRIDEGRIVTKTDRKDSELFSELSDGERAALAIEVTVPRLPEDGLLIAPQWMFEGWTESTKQAVDATLKEHGVVMLTAEARDGELAVEVFESDRQATEGDV